MIVQGTLFNLFLLVSCKCQNIGHAVFMTDAVTVMGAQCLDGSAGLLYIAQGQETTKYFIYFQGGGWCSGYEQSSGKGFDSCWHRRNAGAMGSTKGDPLTMPLNSTFGMGTDPTINPTMYNWNHIYVRYCDGGSFSGNRMDPIIQNNTKMYFRGKRILDALIQTLKNDFNFDKATDVVISGGSAGGLATFVHTNYIANMVDLKRVKMVSLPNVGFFLQYNGYKGSTNYSNGMEWIYENMNVSSSIIDSNCLLFDQCIFPQNIAGDNIIPTFVFNSQYDSWQVNNILGTTNATLINEFGNNFTNLLLNNYMKKNENNGGIYAAFINSCCYHDGDYNTYWYDLMIDGDTTAQAFDKFYKGLDLNETQKLFWFQNETYPCSNCCPSSEPQTCHYY